MRTSGSLTLGPALGILPLVGLLCLMIAFALSYYILFCHIGLLSLRNLFFSNERQNAENRTGQAVGLAERSQERETLVQIYYVRK